MPSPRLPISVCIISGPEAERIPIALASVVDWVTDINVVINDDVNDGTDRVCEKYGAKVFREPWKGFGAQKNSAADKATCEWLLNLDADEEVTPQLRAEIERAIASPGDNVAFSFPRCTQFQGRWIRHGDWYPDRQTRLWRKGTTRWSDDIVHEKPEVNGPVGQLKGDLRHHLADSFNRQVEKLLRYADLFVEQRGSKRVGLWDLAFRPVWRFVRCYFLRLGLLDGLPGFAIAWFSAFYTFVRYSKALERKRRPVFPARHILIYEPRVEGHHVSNLRHVTADLLAAGHQLTLALDSRPESQARLRAELGGILDRVKVIAARGRSGADKIKFLSEAQQETGADRVFLANFDELASSLLRRAAFGLRPPANLRGRISGSYSRPRFLGRKRSLNQLLKAVGFARLMRDGWIDRLLFPDPYIAAQLASDYPGKVMRHIPTPVPEEFAGDTSAARQGLGIPPGKKVFLFFGGGYQRKGLHLAVAAMEQLPPDSPAFLLHAGELPDDLEVQGNLGRLVAAGRAKSLARYVTSEEEKLVFAAADFVLLPYLGHFGTSGVQSQAAGAGKPVIASDEGLVGRLVRERGLGPVFPTGDVAAFAAELNKAIGASAADLAQWRAAGEKFGREWSRSGFRRVMTEFFAD